MKKSLSILILFIISSAQAMDERIAAFYATQTPPSEGEERRATRTKLNEELLFATKEGNVAEVENLLAQGVALDPIENEFWWDDAFNIHALGMAAFAGHKEICELLIARKAQVNHRTFSGSTPLMYACNYESYDYNLERESETRAALCKLLLDHGAEVNAHDIFGKTAILYLEEYEDTMTHDFLKSHGAITDLQALIHQARSNVPAIYSDRQEEALAEAFKTSSTDNDPNSFALMLAVGAHQCLNGKSGRDALFHAAANNQLGCSKSLLEQKINPNFSILSDSSTPLSHAARYKHIEMAKLLMAHGALGYQRALLEAIEWPTATQKNLEMCELLIEALLQVPNKTQKKSIVVLLGCFKKRMFNQMSEIYRHRLDILKPIIREILYAQNKAKFTESVAYDAIQTKRYGTKRYEDITTKLCLKYCPPLPEPIADPEPIAVAHEVQLEAPNPVPPARSSWCFIL